MSRNDLKVSAHFNLREFACRCGEFCGGFVVYDPRLIRGLEKLRVKLEILRQHGYVPDEKIYISSACRCFRHNRSEGGVDGSEHTFIGDLGAADVRTDRSKLSPHEFALLAWGQSIDEVSDKYPKLSEWQAGHVAERIPEFRRVGVYGKALNVPGYHGKRNFVHLGIEEKRVEGYPLPARWGDWPDLVEYYKTHPEKYEGRKL